MNTSQFELYTSENKFKSPMGFSAVHFTSEDIVGIDIELKNISKTLDEQNNTLIDCIVDSKFTFNNRRSALFFKDESTDPTDEGNPMFFSAFIRTESTASLLIEKADRIKVKGELYNCTVKPEMINFLIANIDINGTIEINHQNSLCPTLLANDHDFFNSQFILHALRDLLTYKVSSNVSEYI